MRKFYLVFSLGILFLFNQANAQPITVNNAPTATQLANILAGSNLVVSNAVLTGANTAKGSFQAFNNNLGMWSGVILSTGLVSTAPGPNTAGNTSNNLGTPGTAQMTALAGTATHDAITLEFDFTVQSDMIQFNYVFASEEYPEYAPPNNSSYNDVFAFFISGPGIIGEENIALIPSTTLPVTINNINAITNSQYYVDNTGGQDVSFDAFTTLLTAIKTGLYPCNTYHLKLVIADAGDALYNSAVLLQENSLVQGVVDVTTNTISANDTASEGCVKASFTFGLDQPSSQDKIIHYKIAGTATNGIDYAVIDTMLTIPAGQTQAQVFIDAFADGIPEGVETIYIIYKPEVCAPYDTAKLYIRDAMSIVYTLDPTDLTCNGNHTGQILINASGGFPPYTYEVKDQSGVITPYTSNPITGLNAGTYVVYVYDIYGCKAEAQVVGGLFNAGTTFLPDGSGVTYTSTIPISGLPAGSTLTSLSMLQNVCMNMEHSYLGDLDIKLLAPGGQLVTLKSGYLGGSCDLGEPIATGPIDGSAGSLLTDPGVGYDYCFNTSPMYGTMGDESQNYYRNYTDSQGHSYYDSYLPAGSYTSEQSLSALLGTPLNGNWTIQIIDNMYLDNGYLFNWTISFVGDSPDSVAVIGEPAPITLNSFITDATCGSNNGAINISVTGNYPPYMYFWSNGASTEDIVGLFSGTYSVTVIDAQNCQTSMSFNVSNIGTLDLTANITPILCAGNNTGAIDITPSGGQTPYIFAWSNSATTEDITSLAAGNYTVTVTDNMGCKLIRSFTVTTNPPIQISLLSLQNEQCGTLNGEITLSATGGSGSYGYHWSNGASTASITGLSAGTYLVTVTDANSCTTTHSYNIINDVSNCSAYCYLDVVINSITDDMCGNGVGAFDITVTNAAQPYVFIWSNSAITEDQSGLTQGTYTITVTDANQCVKIKTLTVGNNTGTLAVSSHLITNETCGSSNGAIDITVTGGALPYQYLWSNLATTQDVSNLSAGTYTVQIKDANNCILNASYTVQNNAGNLAVTGVIVHEVCGADNGRITQTVTGGFGIPTFLWSNSSVQQNLINLSAGIYTCTVTDGGGCSFINSYIVQNLPGNLSITNTHVTNEICTNHAGAIDLTVSGVSPTYLWSNSDTTEDITGLAAGTYSCTVTNSQGCTVTTGPINVFDAPGTLSVATGNIIDDLCNSGNGSVTVHVTGGTLPYTFLWSNSSTSQNIYSLHGGNYSLVVTDSNGCHYNYNCTVQDLPGTLAIQNGVVTNETCGNSNGAINILVTGGTTPYSYNWSNSTTTEDVSGLPAGTYSVTVTANNGCVQTASYNVTNIANGMALTWQITNELCSNAQGAIDLSVSGGTSPYTYSWSNLAVAQDLTGLSAGNYSCTATDNGGCHSITGNIIVNNNAAGMSSSTAVTNEICSNAQGGINLSVSGGAPPLEFLWSNGATTQNISALVAGTYSYTVTDADSCMNFGSATVINTAGTLNYSWLISDEQCNNNAGAIDLAVTGGATPYAFLWSNAETTEDITALNAGTYSCTITDNNGCVLTTAIATVADNPGSLEITSMVVTDEVCGNHLGKIDLTIAGGNAPFTYNWSNGLHTQDLLNLQAGNYSITVIDNSGCSVVGQVVVNNDNGAFNINAYAVTDEHCSNHLGAIDISVQGGTTPYTYSWSSGPTTQDLTNLSAGAYSVYVHDALGCSTTGAYSIANIGANFQISNVAITHETCNAGSGAIDITPSGGTTPYTFNWSNGDHSEDVIGLIAGSYSVTITDVNGCSITGSYQVNNLPGTMVFNGNASDEYCGNGLGAVVMNVTGGATPYSYTWSNSATTQSIYNLHAGTYTLTITDHLGCSGTFTGIVNNNTNGFAAQVDSTKDETCGNQTGAVFITASGGTAPYTFLWSNADVTEDISGVHGGNYSVTVTDDIGCSVILNSTVSNITGTLAFSFTNTADEDCSNGEGFIDIEVSGGTTPYSYIWSNSSVTQDLSGLSAGIYSVTVTDDSGCQLLHSFVINNNTNLHVTGSVTGSLCNLGNGGIDITVTGAIIPITYAWSNSHTTEDISNLGAGNYTVTVTDAAGCSSVSSYQVNQLTNPGLVFTYLAVTNDYCEQGSGIIDFNATGGAWLSYYLNNVDVGWPYIPNLSAGTYLISVIDENGCRIDSTVVVGNDSYLNVVATVTDETCGNGNGSISLNSSATSYSWSTGLTGASITNLSAGTYICTVSDGSCTEVDTFIVNNEYDFTVQSAINSDSCGIQSGAIDLTVTGAGPFQYSWSNSATTQDLNNIVSGIYTCTITNTSSGCIRTMSFIVPSISSGVAVNSMIYPDTCSSGLGSIVNNVYGGSGNYSFHWSHGPTTLNAYNLTAGNYTITITDNNDACMVTSFYTIQDKKSFTVSGSVMDATCLTCPDGSITLNPSDLPGFVNLYTFAWSNSSSSQNQSGLLPGNYSVTVTSNYGCDTVLTFTVGYANGIPVEVSGGYNMNVYPNPATDDFLITFSVPEKNDASLIISDMNGRIIFHSNVHGKNKLMIQSADFAAGIYNIAISGERIYLHKKLVIVK